MKSIKNLNDTILLRVLFWFVILIAVSVFSIHAQSATLSKNQDDSYGDLFESELMGSFDNKEALDFQK